MFDAPWLERLSVAHPTVAFWSTPRPACGFVARVASGMAAVALVVGGYVAGLLIWSLLEYVAHRASFHHAPTSRLQVAFAYLMHGVHHAYPDDSRRWVMPLGVTLPITIALYLVVGRLVGAPVFGGFLHGYLTYDLLHYFIHLGRLPTRSAAFSVSITSRITTPFQTGISASRRRSGT